MNHRRYKDLTVTWVLALLLGPASLLLAPLVPASFAQITAEDVGTEKLAQTSFKFLQISTDPRAAALGDAMTAVDFNSSGAMFYNPAGMAGMSNSFSASGNITNWIAGISYNSASAAMSTTYGVFGVSLLFANYGDDIIGTIVANNERGYEEYEELGFSNPNPNTMAIGLGYALAVTDRFSVGANAKYASQDLSEALVTLTPEEGMDMTEANEANTIAFDFGLIYRTGFRSLNLAMSVRNFAQELQYVDENFELPLTFNVGMSMNMFDLTAMDPNLHAFNLSVEAERPRDFAEQIKIGGEYTLMNIFSVRAGYSYPSDQQGVNLGAGLKYETDSGLGFGVNYAFTDFGDFSAVHRMGVTVSL